MIQEHLLVEIIVSPVPLHYCQILDAPCKTISMRQLQFLNTQPICQIWNPIVTKVQTPNLERSIGIQVL